MVCYKISSNHFSPVFHIIDPAQGDCKFSMNEFRRFFENREGKGVVLFLTPSESFKSFKQESTKETNLYGVLCSISQKYKELEDYFGGNL